MRLALRVLILVALPGLIFGSLIQALAARESACVPPGESGLLGFGLPPCPSTDYGAFLAVGLMVAVAALVVGAVRAGPR